MLLFFDLIKFRGFKPTTQDPRKQDILSPVVGLLSSFSVTYLLFITAAKPISLLIRCKDKLHDRLPELQSP